MTREEVRKIAMEIFEKCYALTVSDAIIEGFIEAFKLGVEKGRLEDFIFED